MNTHQFILKNWKTSIRNPKNKKDASLSFVKLPNSYTTPCADDEFKNFYYWDTYFTNIGLLEDGLIDQARNNLRVMKFFISKFLFIPNADHLLFGSQPPFFSRGIFELYSKTKDVNDIKEFLYSAVTEMNFWKFDRMTPCGLNQYGCGWLNCKCVEAFDYFANRVGGLTEAEKKVDRAQLVKGFFAIAESGWDLNVRYRRAGLRFDALSFANIDLNSILYDAENCIAKMAKIIDEKEIEKEFSARAKVRKELMTKLMMDPKTGIFYDYSFVDKKNSGFLSAASLFPYAFGISDDKKSAKAIFDRLDCKYGLSTCEERGNDQYLQWDFPHMWPPVVYLAYQGLKNVGLLDEAKLLKKQYLDTVDKNFEATGRLWEKYDTVKGDVSVTVEYKTPTMLGWTAGVYEYLLNN